MALVSFTSRVGRLVARRPGMIVLLTLAITAGFVTALATIPAAPSSDSFEGSDATVQAEDRIEDAMPPTGLAVPFLVGSTAADGNAISRASFDEVLAREQALRDDPELVPFTYTYIHPYLQTEVPSIWGLPDSLRAFMNNETILTYALGWHPDVGGPGATYEGATDAEWQDALTRLLDYEDPSGDRPFARSVSVDGQITDGTWTARTLFLVPTYHRATVFAAYTQDPAEATADRPLFEELQFATWDRLEEGATRTDYLGVGLGINTEVAREVAESGRLVLVSFVGIGILLYLTLRNFRDFVIAYLALPVLITWMLGAARLIGLSVNQFTAMLPVLILALGVDFAIHGVRRYREERAAHEPRAAVARSVTLLGPALILAAATTATAFFSNAFSDVAALRDWGIEGGIAIVSALWICGVAAPAARHLWDRRRVKRGRLSDDARASVTARRIAHGTFLGRIATKSGARPTLVLVLIALVTVPALVTASQITSDFNANDFLDPDSDLIAGVERVNEDYPSEGEPAILLIEGDIADPDLLRALRDGMDAFAAAGYRPEQAFTIVRVIQTAMEYPDANEAYYLDADGDRIPDRRQDVRSLLGRALEEGVWVEPELPTPPPFELAPGIPAPGLLQPEYPTPPLLLAYAPETVRELVHPTPTGGYDMTLMYFGIPGTQEFSVIPQAAADLRTAAPALYAMQGGKVQDLTLTGEPFKRYAMVQSITQSLQISITISVIVCFLIVLAVFRDPAYAFVTTLPVVVLVTWLFAFMVLVGLSLNLVTVTVAAMAIGVGIDYSIHITERFREEARTNKRAPLEALRVAMDSAGIALFGSALTTITGFLVLVFAPMPLFATFGFITAAMAAASFLAAATILPPLLVVVENRHRRRHRVVAAPRIADAQEASTLGAA